MKEYILTVIAMTILVHVVMETISLLRIKRFEIGNWQYWVYYCIVANAIVYLFASTHKYIPWL